VETGASVNVPLFINEGDKIKIDTAMDYNKNHPAHKIAMNFIRGKMAGISNRAGIPKNRKK
jgi:hypothetical protein